jgi:hypothetical protein
MVVSIIYLALTAISFRVACDLSFFQSDVGAYAIGSGGQFCSWVSLFRYPG